MPRIFTLALLGLLVCLPCGAIARPLGIPDMARIVNLEEPAISPDGATVALIRERQDALHASVVDRLILIDTRSGRTIATVAADDPSVPRWSPDGRHLGFLASANGVRQVFRYSPASVRQVTHAAADVIDFAWSPDGRTLAFAATDPPANAGALARHHDYFFAGANDYTATALAPPVHLWTIPATGGTAVRVTSGSWTIVPTDPGGIFSPQIAWMPNGRGIAFARVATTFSGEDEHSTLWSIDLKTRAMTKLTSHPMAELSPSYSPDGRYLAYSWARDGDFTAENTVRVQIAHADLAMAPSFDRNIGGAIWFPDSRRMLTCATDRTATLAWIVDLRGATPLPLGGLNIVCDTYQSATFDSGIDASIARDGTIAFLGDDARHARELFLLRPGTSAPRKLTHFNDWLAGIDLGRMSQLDWDSADGFHEDGVVTYPPGYDSKLKARPATKFPAVLLIHGGPGLSSIRQFAGEEWPLAQEIAARGYVVLQPNYRGSDNIGNAFTIAIDGDSAAGPGRDIMDGLAALEKNAPIDPTRIGVSGWSYGGLLTSWLIGHTHDFHVAVSGAAVNDEFEEYNLSTSNVQDRYLLGAAPYSAGGLAVYREQSPITYYKDITTPTLIWGTTLDPVVPIPQAYALYHALNDNHVPVKLLIFPAATHGPSNPVQRADLTRFWLDWLDRYLAPH